MGSSCSTTSIHSKSIAPSLATVKELSLESSSKDNSHAMETPGKQNAEPTGMEWLDESFIKTLEKDNLEMEKKMKLQRLGEAETFEQVAAGSSTRSPFLEMEPQVDQDILKQLNIHQQTEKHSDIPTASNFHQQMGKVQDQNEPNEPVDCNQTYHEIDTTNYQVPEEDDDVGCMSLAIDPNDPFDEAQVKIFLSRLQTPLHEHENYIQIDGDLPKMTKTVVLGMFSIYGNF